MRKRPCGKTLRGQTFPPGLDLRSARAPANRGRAASATLSFFCRERAFRGNGALRTTNGPFPSGPRCVHAPSATRHRGETQNAKPENAKTENRRSAILTFAFCILRFALSAADGRRPLVAAEGTLRHSDSLRPTIDCKPAARHRAPCTAGRHCRRVRDACRPF